MRLTYEVLGELKAEALRNIAMALVKRGAELDIVDVVIRGLIVDKNRPYEHLIWVFKSSDNPLKNELLKGEYEDSPNRSVVSVMMEELMEEARKEKEKVMFVNTTNIQVPKKYQHMLEVVERDGDGYWAYAREGYQFAGMGCSTAHEYTQKELLDMIRTLKAE